MMTGMHTQIPSCDDWTNLQAKFNAEGMPAVGFIRNLANFLETDDGFIKSTVVTEDPGVQLVFLDEATVFLAGKAWIKTADPRKAAIYSVLLHVIFNLKLGLQIKNLALFLLNYFNFPVKKLNQTFNEQLPGRIVSKLMNLGINL